MLKQLESKHELFNSADEMLAPENLSHLLQRKVSRVDCQPFKPSDGFSGNQMYQVTADDKLLVMKCLMPTVDWIAIATDDHQCRSVRVWQYGLLDRIRPYMDHAILAACRDRDDYAILMYDVSDGLFAGKEITTKTIHTLLDSLAAMHAMFWEDDTLNNFDLGLCGAEQLVRMCWPIHFDRYRHDTQSLEYLSKGWEALFELLDADVRNTLQSLMNNPHPLFDTLASFPSTFIHADYRTGNLALMPETNQIVAFDWQDAGYAPATICLSWFLMSGSISTMRDKAAEYYRQQLVMRLGSRFDQRMWQRMLEVGYLVDVLRKGCWHAMFAVSYPDEAFGKEMRQSVDSYNAIVRNGSKWL